MNVSKPHTVVAQTARRGWVLAALLALALICAGASFAQSNAAPSQVAKPVPAKSGVADSKAVQSTEEAMEKSPAVGAEKSPAKGTQEGIKIHGHWIIEVRDPDGKVVTHREFENALLQGGGEALSNFLLGTWVPQGWGVELGGTLASQTPASQANPCGTGTISVVTAPSGVTTTSVSGVGFCQLVDPGSSLPGFNCTAPAAGQYCVLTRVPVLGTVFLAPTGAVPGFALQGSFSASAGGYVGSVATRLFMCAPSAEFTFPQQLVDGLNSSSPASCYAGSATGQQAAVVYFSATAVNPPVQVQPTQAVSVTVQFSFQ